MEWISLLCLENEEDTPHQASCSGSCVRATVLYLSMSIAQVCGLTTTANTGVKIANAQEEKRTHPVGP